MSDDGEHTTVLLEEAVNLLVGEPDGFYIDATYGRGGHSAAILSRLSPAGRVLAIDRDPQVVGIAQHQSGQDERFNFINATFDQIEQLLNDRAITTRPHGVLFDLGVSSPQLDQAERGFSFSRDGPLDMRMDRASGETVAHWLAQAEESEIARVLYELGEERHSRKIARKIVDTRLRSPLVSTHQLATLIRQAIPGRDPHKHPATRSFQALRIFINDELGQLQRALPRAFNLLANGGRLVVISFHSLEDRMVKRFMRDRSRGTRYPDRLPIPHQQTNTDLRIIGKPVKPSDQEINSNPRARSAIMRTAERIGGVHA